LSLKAVSPLIATGVLLVITLVGGVLVYNFVIRSLSATHNYGLINVVSARGIVLGDKTIISVRIANIGTASTEVREVVLYPTNISIPISVAIEPGVTRNINIVINGKLESGKYYVIVKYDHGESEPCELVFTN